MDTPTKNVGNTSPDRPIKIDPKQAIFVAVVVVLLIIVIHNNMVVYKIYSNQLEGLWTAPESFCKQSDIDGMLVYVGPPLSSSILSSDRRKVCLIIHGNNTTIAYKKLEIKMSSPFMDIVLPFVGISSKWSRAANVIDDTKELSNPEVNIMDESDDVSTIPLEKIMPDRVTITVDLNEGKMTWVGRPLLSSRRKDSENSEDVTYAELYKDNASSAIGKNLTEVHSDAIDLDAQIPDTE